MTGWLIVQQHEFEAFIRTYPRPLRIEPPLSRKATFRQWIDETQGSGFDGAVAKVNASRRSHVYEVLRSCESWQARRTTVADVKCPHCAANLYKLNRLDEVGNMAKDPESPALEFKGGEAFMTCPNCQRRVRFVETTTPGGLKGFQVAPVQGK